MAARFAANQELWHPADATFEGCTGLPVRLGKSEAGRNRTIGVRKRRNKWDARVTVKGKGHKYLGMFKTIELAAAAVRKFKAGRVKK